MAAGRPNVLVEVVDLFEKRSQDPHAFFRNVIPVGALAAAALVIVVNGIVEGLMSRDDAGPQQPDKVVEVVDPTYIP